MDLTAELDAPCPSDVLFAHVDDLGRYPDWLEIVERAEAAELHPDDDGDAAWMVDLRGRLGPLARSKRLRMVRTELQAPDLVRFERREHDGREHSPWVLDARVDERRGREPARDAAALRRSVRGIGARAPALGRDRPIAPGALSQVS